MLDFVFVLFVGALVGVFTGLMPGIHINTIAAGLLATSVFLLNYFSPFEISIFILVVAIVHSFVDFIPSIYLGAPEPETALSILPGHQLLMKGQGYEAVALTVFGGIFGFLFVLGLSPLLFFFLNAFYFFVEQYMAFILIIISLLLILRDPKIFWAATIFLLSGALGFMVLRAGFIDKPLFPMLSGLFGASFLLFSILHKTTLPLKQDLNFKVYKSESLQGGITGTIAGTALSFLPGVGPAQANILAMEINPALRNVRTFLIATGAINTVNVFVCLLTLYLLEKTRSGAVVAISIISPNLVLNEIFVLIAACFFAVFAGAVLTLFLGKHFIKIFALLDYILLIKIVLLFLFCMVVFMCGFYGLLVFTIAMFLGILPNYVGCRHSQLMGVLLVPTILWFLGI